MAGKSYMDAFIGDFAAGWEPRRARAQAGDRRGGGFCARRRLRDCDECDLIIAADNAKFGQPEIKLGVIPGIGGTQRLTRAVGKAKAMDMCLTGRMMDAQEAERSGLVARVVPAASLMDEAIKTAETIAAMSLPAVMMAKEAINRAFETTLAEGDRFERRVFHSLFATQDQKEGMAAFVGKAPGEVREQVSLRCSFRTQITRVTDALAASIEVPPLAGSPWRLPEISGSRRRRRARLCTWPLCKSGETDELTLRVDRRRACESRRRRGHRAPTSPLSVPRNFALKVRHVAAAILNLRIANADQREFGAARRLRRQGHRLEIPRAIDAQ